MGVCDNGEEAGGADDGAAEGAVDEIIKCCGHLSKCGHTVWWRTKTGG